MLSIGVILVALFAQQQPACEQLKSLSLKNVTITNAEFVAAAGKIPAHCKVAATLTPTSDSHIEMELWMPAESWNGKFLALGNGGWAGNIETRALANALSRGYAAASNDTGHKGATAAFAVGHPEKLVDFGYRSMHEMAIQSKAIIQRFYNRAPQLSYYQGCSTGGRQGMMEAQRYPDDFDAIIAGAPVYNQIRLNLATVAPQVEMLREPAKILSPVKVTLLSNAVVAACDEKDGVKDGIISDPQMCKFDPAVLMCKARDGADCLTAPQVEIVKKAYAPMKLKSGQVAYPGHSPGFEPQFRVPTPGAPMNPLYADAPRYLGHQDAKWDIMSFDIDKDLPLALENAGSIVEANDPNLAKFKARGGKLLLWHGWADPGPAPENTINYYNEVTQKLGGKQDDWLRLFLLPGVGHCGGGVGPDQADWRGAMEKWKESGTAPVQVVATRAPRNGLTELSRPICPYPQIAKYTGSGDTNNAKNFVCAAR